MSLEVRDQGQNGVADRLLEAVGSPEIDSGRKRILQLRLIDQHLASIPAEILVGWAADESTSQLVISRLARKGTFPEVLNALLTRALADVVDSDPTGHAKRLILKIAANPNTTEYDLERIMQFAITSRGQEDFFGPMAAREGIDPERQAMLYRYGVALATVRGDSRLLEALSGNPDLDEAIAAELVGYRGGRFQPVSRRFPHAMRQAPGEIVLEVVKGVTRGDHCELADMLLVLVQNDHATAVRGWRTDVEAWAKRTLASIEADHTLRYRSGLDIQYICNEILSNLQRIKARLEAERAAVAQQVVEVTSTPSS